MEKLGLNEIRERYLSFFESKGHLRLNSFSLVPQNDASLLLINAGMAPLKAYFTGKEVPPRKRVTTCQKCIRTPDIERVGKTARHGTFFEMLGNFSFGDYFKHEATAFAWEFITKDLKMPVDKLWVTIYEDDDEAFDIWTNEIGVSPERIVRMGKEDNFWEHGTGPCGPCSEIYFDRGEKYGCGSPDCKVGCECDRFCEFWNLVFTQFDKDEQGNYNRLKNPNIDTGMGLERIAAIMQDVPSLFDVDTVKNIMNEIAKLAGVKYGQSDKIDVSLRVVTDHIRSTTFMISDGVVPSNEGRGYVLRRLLRRGARHGKLLGIEGKFMHKICDTVIKESKGAYPELEEKCDYIKKVIEVEESRFAETINQGLEILQGYIDQAKKEGKTVLSGENVFKLYDTYGFPIDLTKEIADENGLSVDEEGFNSLMLKQRETARERRKDGSSWDSDDAVSFKDNNPTEFIGYDNLKCDAEIVSVVVENKLAQEAGVDTNLAVELNKTVFYGESGGQLGDTGKIYSNDFEIAVTDCKKLPNGKFLHMGKVTRGIVTEGSTVTAEVDAQVRMNTTRNHSATHLLQKALIEVLGTHVHQAGSLVTPEKLRFDFTHFAAMTKEEIALTEQKVNEAILKAMPIEIKNMPLDEAKKLGATALFGEKYGNIVRVVKMGDYSTEFCGGCHLDNTSRAGLFKILSESGISAGVRRIEAVTGNGVLALIKDCNKTIEDTARILKSNVSEVCEKAEALVDELKTASKTIEQYKEKLASGELSGIISSGREIKGVTVFTASINDAEADQLRTMGDKLKDKYTCCAGVLAGILEEKIVFVAFATRDAVEKGVHCGNIIREVSKIAGGGGGGKPDSAQAGGKLKDKVGDALSAVYGIAEQFIK